MDQMGPGDGARARSRMPGRGTPEDVRRILGKSGEGGRRSFGRQIFPQSTVKGPQVISVLPALRKITGVLQKVIRLNTRGVEED
jgi:hypothetical protein